MMLCITLYIFQNFFNKLFSLNYSGKTSAAPAVFNCIYGLIVSFVVFSVCNRFSFSASGETFIFSFLEGIVLFLFNIGVTRAAVTGPFSFQSIMVISGNIVIALMASALFWRDPISHVQLLGIALMLLSFYVLNKNGLDFSGVKKGYFIWIALAFFANGSYGVIMDAHQRIMLLSEKNEMIIITFLFSALISAVYLAITEKKEALSGFRMGKRALCFAMASSISAAFAVYLVMILLGLVPVSILYSIQNGAIMAGNIILGALVLKEHLSKNAIIGILMIIVSIVMLSI